MRITETAADTARRLRDAIADRRAGVPLASLVGSRPLELDARIAMAQRCRDCDDLPKAQRAGEVVIDDDGIPVQIMHNGLRVLAGGYCGAWTTELIGACEGHYEPQEERVVAGILERLGADATMIELGAWWSYYSLWFLQGEPGRTAVALEPDPERRAVGEANAVRNGSAPRFVSGFVGAVPSPSEPFVLDSGERINVPRVTVRELMQTHGIDTLDVLHCDAQGAETDVLGSITDLLRAGRVRTVIVSTHHHSISGDPLTHQKCLAIVQRCGGKVLAEHDVHESFSGDGLIAARFGPDRDEWPEIPISLNRYSHSQFRNPLYEVRGTPYF